MFCVADSLSGTSCSRCRRGDGPASSRAAASVCRRRCRLVGPFVAGVAVVPGPLLHVLLLMRVGAEQVADVLHYQVNCNWKKEPTNNIFIWVKIWF